MRYLRLLCLGLCAVLALALPGDLVHGQGSQATNNTAVAENDTTTGTQLYMLAKIDAATGKLVQASAADTAINLYPVTINAGTTGTALYVTAGDAACIMDATNAPGTGCGGGGCAGKPIVISPTSAPRCHVQANPPASGMVIGTLAQTGTTVNQQASITVGNQPYIPGSGTGLGSVTSVGLTMPSEFSVAGSPITGAGVFTVTKASQAANVVMAGPASGGAAVPTYRALAAADLPPGTASGACGGDLGASFPNCTVTKASGAWARAGDNAVTLAGPGDNFAPTNFATTYRQLINGGAAVRRISGFLAPATTGVEKEICNAGTQNIVLGNQDSASSTANQLSLLDDVTLRPNACVPIQYDVAATRWRSMVSASPNYDNVKLITLIIGDTASSAPALLDDSDTPNAWTNGYRRPFVIKAVACASNDVAPAPTVLPVLHGGADTSILTGPCACGLSNEFGAACTVNGTPTVLPATQAGATCSTPPCKIDVRTVLAGGTSRYYVVNIEGELQ